MRFLYKGISFGKDIVDLSFSEFEKMFSSNHIFKAFPPPERAKELKKVYNSALKHYGKFSKSSRKRKEAKTDESKE